MTTGAKRKFKSFEVYYQKGTLQPHFIENIRKYEKGLRAEDGVVQSWFDYCEEKYGKIEQPQLIAFEILEKSSD